MRMCCTCRVLYLQSAVRKQKHNKHFGCLYKPTKIEPEEKIDVRRKDSKGIIRQWIASHYSITKPSIKYLGIIQEGSQTLEERKEGRIEKLPVRTKLYAEELWRE